MRIRLPQIIMVLITLVILLVLVGCGGEREPELQATSIEELVTETAEGRTLSPLAEELAGQEVTLQGWMSPLSPLHTNYIYLISTPSEECPFCAGMEVDYYDVVIVYVEDNLIVPFTFEPVAITGILEVGQVQDGHVESFFRLQSKLSAIVNIK